MRGALFQRLRTRVLPPPPTASQTFYEVTEAHRLAHHLRVEPRGKVAIEGKETLPWGQEEEKHDINTVTEQEVAQRERERDNRMALREEGE